MTFPGIEPDGQAILTNKEILDIDHIPKSLLVIGAGAVGIEFASLFARFGTDVTVLEMLPRILPLEDRDISDELHKLLSKRRIRMLTGTRLEGISVQEGKVVASVYCRGRTVQTLTADKALIAAGRKPVTEGIGLESPWRHHDARIHSGRPPHGNQRAGHICHRRCGADAAAGARGFS